MDNKKRKISLLSITLGSGGAEKVISLLLKLLVKDFDVTLVLFYHEIHFNIPQDVKVIILSDKHQDRSLILKNIDSFRFISKYNRFIKKNNISISISFLAFPNLVNGVISMLNSNVKTIISERGFPSDNVTSKFSLLISKIFYPIFYNKCDKLFSNSVHINRDLKENFKIRIPMSVIYNPIEKPKTRILPEDLNTGKKSLKIVTAGTINTRKNQIMIIRALNETKNNDKLTILGSGHLKEFLIEEITKFKLEDQISLEGKVKNVNEYLLNNDCFVLSSFTEGFPNALIEAMAIGLPCISTNCLSGPLELLNENQEIVIESGNYYKAKYGLLVNNDDHVGLSKALEYFRNNSDERERYSRLSLKRAEEYQLETIYLNFKEFITE